MKIFVAGHITVDEIVYAGKTITSLGGPPSYTGLVLRSLGADVYIVSAVGGDFPEDYWNFLEKYVYLKYVAKVPEAKTTRFRLIYSGESRELYLVSRCIDLSEVPTEAEYIHVSPVAQELPLTVFEKDCLFLSLDPQGYLRKFSEDGKVVLYSNKELLSRLHNVNHLRISLNEAEVLLGEAWPKYFMKLSKEHKVLVSLGLGAKGVIIFNEGKLHYIPPYATSAKQSTGAGDAYAGGFLQAYLSEEDPLWAAAIGSAAASLVVEKPGPTLINRKEVEARASELYSKHRTLFSVEEVYELIKYSKET